MSDGGAGPGAPGTDLSAYQHPLVEALEPNPHDPPVLVMLTGYLGDSDQSGHKRLYRDADLRE